MSTALPLFLTCPAGVEPLLAAEALSLGGDSVRERRGGVELQASLQTAYRICLWSRLASRVLLTLARFPLNAADDLYREALAYDWSDLFAVERSFVIEVAGRHPAFNNTQFAVMRLKDAVADQFRSRCGRRPNVDPESPDVRIHLHLDRDSAGLSLDLSGESLHRRGWRGRTGEAPLKENLACALLVRAGWPALAEQGAGLLDPMCGSGTLVIEAALMAADCAPGISRQRWGFQGWSAHQPALWAQLLDEALARRRQGLLKLPPMRGADVDPGLVELCRRHARAAGLGEHIQWQCADISTQAPHELPAGLVIFNPPYGERLAAEGDVIMLMSLAGDVLKNRFGGWKAAIFTGRPDLAPRLGLRADSLHAFYNGKLPCKLLCFDLRPAPPAVAAPANASADAARPPLSGEEFANRLEKNLRHLGKWARRRQIGCYRVYDADLPAYAVSIDIYAASERHVHIHEYAAPSEIDPVKAERRLRDALAHTARLLDVPASRLHFRQRRVLAGSDQYQKQGDSGQRHQVSEHGVPLWVNFEDYMDSGLFLDHRPLRLRIQQEARDKRFLNLFCYTASATAHAIAGGALATQSVDMSMVYLEWARDNLRLSGVEPLLDDGKRSWGHARAPHRLLRADCLRWLADQCALPAAPRYDLILLDPPTFSNSKRMDGVLDIERDHPQLIRQAAQLLAPAGQLYFSTNKRRFRLDEAALQGLQVEDITAATIDEDFRRGTPPHRAWRIRRD